MKKSPDAFRTITEVADWLDTPAHVLRFWESRFSQIKPVKRAGGRRYYRPADMLLLGGIKKLLHDDGTTIKGVQNLIREKGVKYIQSLSQPVAMSVKIKKKNKSLDPAPVQTDDAPKIRRIEPNSKNTDPGEPPAPEANDQIDEINPMVRVKKKPSEPDQPALVLDTHNQSKQISLFDDDDGLDADTDTAVAELAALDLASEANLIVGHFPSKLKQSKEISYAEMQEIEAFYYSLKMVRNNMKRTSAKR